MKRSPALTTALAIALALTFSAAGCGGQAMSPTTATAGAQTAISTARAATTSAANETSVAATSTQVATTISQDSSSTAIHVGFDSEDKDASWDSAQATSVELADGASAVSGEGARVSGNTLTINQAGTYVLSGKLSDGQVFVQADQATVRLVLNGVSISNSTTSPLFIAAADKVVLTLADGTENTLSDGATYVYADSQTGEPSAALFSKADLSINGTGSLTVTGNYQDGIASKDDLKIVSGTISVKAVRDAIRGRDCIGIKEGTITVEAGADGLQSNNDTDPERGNISIDGGSIRIAAGEDGIQAETTLLVRGGDIQITTGGGSANPIKTHTDGFGGTGGRPGAVATMTSSSSNSVTAKGLKAGTAIAIEDGALSLDSADDAINCNGTIVLSGGSLILASGDDAIRGDTSVDLTGSDIDITTSYEGVESGGSITVSGGNIHLLSTDDGFNISGGTDAMGGPGGQAQTASSATTGNLLSITGGYLYIDAGGDGIDVGRPITMSGGTVIVNGPTNDGNGALDYQGSFTCTGGLLLAVGSAGMAQAPSDASTQNSVMVNLTSTQAKGTLIHIESQGGQDVLTFLPSKTYQSVVLCSPDLKRGTTYTVYLGGSAAGSATDGLYSAGSYTTGAQNTDFTVSAVVTTVGQAGRGMNGGGRQGRVPGGNSVPGGSN